MDFGEKIKNIRKEKKMTQEQMANILNVSRQAISNWENNKNFPDLEMIIKISRFFSLTLDELILGDDDTMTKKLIKDGSEVRLVKMNMITIIVASFLLLIGFGCLIVKGLSVEYVDSYGVFHENFFLLPIGFLFIFSGFITFLVIGFKKIMSIIKK
ncbi:DUF3955 domain-containing protein [Clostridium perfringens]|uniref:DNA-binding membrane protein n=2 Tax=Clostridium perfringens TaxID=1502 RepID=A0AAV3F827_CLOPF|nr:DUF3955 domain-containing protein [Clostridium perfringens]EIA15604.1 DNA-binding membrane protein [Clostridium perfringens F262]MDU5317302.1 DUF3955 domain-containing protein [Varibaculum cambriense]